MTVIRWVAALLVMQFAMAIEAVAEEIQVYKSASCGCCVLWMDHMRENGFALKGHDLALGALARMKNEAGLRPDLHSCHTAKIAGYVIEGHVPAAEVRRLLQERPAAIGLVVPGMPIGSPGMEAGDHREPYEVLLVRHDGSTETYATFGKN